MTTVYYNWETGQTRAFPPGFRMITPGEEVFNEGIMSGESEMEISISFQSCWDGINLDSPDHMSHVAFPQGEDGPCPNSHPVRIPRLDFFIRWFNTNSARWRFADDSIRFHADYVSGWDEAFLQSILDGGDGDVDSKVTFRQGIVHDGNDQKLIRKMNEHAVPRADTSCISTEAIDNIVNLPRGACSGTLISPFGVCGPTTSSPTPVPPTPQPSFRPTSPLPTTQPPTPVPTLLPTQVPTQVPTPQPSFLPTTSLPTKQPPTLAPPIPVPPTPQPSFGPTTLLPTPQPPTLAPPTTHPPTSKPTPSPTAHPPTFAPTLSPVSADPYALTDLRWVVCGNGVGTSKCPEGDRKKVHKDEEHEVRCCKEQREDGGGWRGKCEDYDDWLSARSKIWGSCHITTLEEAFQLCNDADGRLCTKEEVENSCTKGTGCNYNYELVWTCAEEGWDCTESAECCNGKCDPDGRCH